MSTEPKEDPFVKVGRFAPSLLVVMKATLCLCTLLGVICSPAPAGQMLFGLAGVVAVAALIWDLAPALRIWVRSRKQR